MVRITSALRRIQEDPAGVLAPHSIRTACQRLGHVWRERQLDPVQTILALITQIAYGNTAIGHVVRLLADAFTASAYCQARQRLPCEVLEVLLRRMVGRLRGRRSPGRWRGLRTCLLDGTGFSMPDVPQLMSQYGPGPNQTPGCGFPVGRIVAMFDAVTGLLMHMVVMPLRCGEMRGIQSVLEHLCPRDLLIGDRAFGSFVHMALLRTRQAHGLFRLHSNRPDTFSSRGRRTRSKGHSMSVLRVLKRLSRNDHLQEWAKPRNRPKWLDAQTFASLPRSMVVRVIRYHVHREGFRSREVRIVTTLTDPQRYPAHELIELYRRRWEVETNLRHLKQTMGMDRLRCKSVQGVRKELLAYAIVYNLVRLVMLEAARREGVAVARVSFIDALRWLMHQVPADRIPRLTINPRRPGRYEPRVVKRRRKDYPTMSKPRSVLKQQLLN